MRHTGAAVSSFLSDQQFLADSLAELERVTRNALAEPHEQLTVRLERSSLRRAPQVVTWSLTGEWAFEPARD